MFTREELLIMYNTLTDVALRDKIASMLFVDKTLIEKIHNAFDEKGLIKIEKSNDTNEYYIHFLLSNEEIGAELLYESFAISSGHSLRKDLRPDIDIIFHSNINDLWFHKEMNQVWNKEGIRFN